jgi:hypothetical protein
MLLTPKKSPMGLMLLTPKKSPMGLMLLTHKKVQGECEKFTQASHTHTHIQILISFCGVEGLTKNNMSLDTKGSK